ncbi:MAG TPA: YbhB/YbcL family Raf kinase inhibitor-like protein [Gemmatimonadaceae bacterium]|jgi:Raf kinase inhibitor-like YbhB/YbcL family protein|nr:YbhB/YbcL family Raf kinase inhibitor-like protein [Gemmatimonadaceae bacterium]
MLVPIRLRYLSFAVVALAAATAPDASAQRNNPPLPRVQPLPRRTGRFTLRAPDLLSAGRIAASHVYNGMGCSGQNISPMLVWSNPPAGTKSFAVTIYDPDAPTGSGWWHWVMYNIPANTTSLAAGAGNGRNAPRGSVQGTTDFGTRGYGGPCPPPGDAPHHYHIKVFALKIDKIDAPGNATAAFIGFNLNANKLATAEIIGRYGR